MRVPPRLPMKNASLDNFQNWFWNDLFSGWYCEMLLIAVLQDPPDFIVGLSDVDMTINSHSQINLFFGMGT